MLGSINGVLMEGWMATIRAPEGLRCPGGYTQLKRILESKMSRKR